MDIPTHILDAVRASSDAPTLPRIETVSQVSPKASEFPALYHHSAHSSAEDVSTTSDSEQHDYQTDFTTPASSDSNSNPDDMQPDDVEDFRDREYPQLKGKTYLDHGGTTVCDHAHSGPSFEY